MVRAVELHTDGLTLHYEDDGDGGGATDPVAARHHPERDDVGLAGAAPR